MYSETRITSQVVVIHHLVVNPRGSQAQWLAHWSQSTKLLYTRTGYYLDG